MKWHEVLPVILSHRDNYCRSRVGEAKQIIRCDCSHHAINHTSSLVDCLFLSARRADCG